MRMMFHRAAAASAFREAAEREEADLEANHDMAAYSVISCHNSAFNYAFNTLCVRARRLQIKGKRHSSLLGINDNCGLYLVTNLRHSDYFVP
jgi:hypothetical protein